MEKQGEIRAGLTNSEHEPEKTAAELNVNKPTAIELDSDFRKLAAETAHNTAK